MSGGFDKVGSALTELPGLYDDLDNLKQVEKKYESQLKGLYTFVGSRVVYLFSFYRQSRSLQIFLTGCGCD